MVTRAERIAAINEFMVAPKRVVRPESVGEWRLGGANDDEREIQWPLEIDGEHVPDAFLKIVGWVRDRTHFRLMVLHSVAICRLDYTDEIHTNPPPHLNRVPPLVAGPHYHSWLINRDFFLQHDPPVRLLNALPYDGGGQSFDAILRWFCDDVNIEPLPPAHRIELPRLEQLL